MKECADHIDHVQDVVRTQGVVISSNGRSRITVSEVQEHSVMPEYPEIANEGILHFIHIKNPIESPSRDPQDVPEEEVHKAFTKTMSKVIIFCGIYKFMLRPYI